jgi:hypothetical protein
MIDLIIQGPEHCCVYKTINNHINNPKINKIIVSTTYILDSNRYKMKIFDYMNKYNKYPENPKLIFLETKIDKKEYFNGFNCYFQYISSYNGFMKASVKSLKIRSSSFYKNLDPFIDEIIKNDNKIIVTDFFFRNVTSAVMTKAGCKENIKYHPSDHIVGGNTNTLIKIFKIAIDISEYNNPIKPSLESGFGPEVIFGISSVLAYGFKLSELIQERYEQLQKIFIIVNIKYAIFSVTDLRCLNKKINNNDYYQKYFKNDNNNEYIYTLKYNYDDIQHQKYFQKLYLNDN